MSFHHVISTGCLFTHWICRKRYGFEQLHQRLGAGESACLALATSRSFLVLTDDIDARRWCHHTEIPVSGTIGLLMQLVQGHALPLDEANNLLQVMREHGYYAPITRLEELLS